MSKTFDEIFQDCIKLRRETKAVIKDTISQEELEAIQRRQHLEQTFMFNAIHGRFGSFNNVLAR